MKSIPTMKTVMTPFPHFIESSKNIGEARVMMSEYDIRHLPVTEKGKLLGIVSERDITLAFSLGQHVLDEEKILVGDICKKDPYAVGPEEKLDKVLIKMAEKHIGSVIVEKNEKPIGIFTTTDACEYFGEFLQSFFDSENLEDQLK